VLLVVVLLRRSYRYHRRQSKAEEPRTRIGQAARREGQPLADAPPEILRWQVEMHETARALKAELDSKMGAIQALIRMAAEERQRLEAAVAHAGRLGISPSRDALTTLEQSDTPPSRPPDVKPDSHGWLPVGEEQRLTICSLADQGESLASIADRVGATVGEVEWILSLRGASHRES
jgi:hypothetical protein